MCFRTEPGRGPSFQGYHGGCRPIRPAPTAHAYYPRRSYRASRAKSMRPRLGCCADRWCAADSAPATLPHLDQNFAVEGGYEPPADSAETSRLPAPNVTWYGAPCVQGDFCVTTFLRYPHPLLLLLHQFSRSSPLTHDLRASPKWRCSQSTPPDCCHQATLAYSWPRRKAQT